MPMAFSHLPPQMLVLVLQDGVALGEAFSWYPTDGLDFGH